MSQPADHSSHRPLKGFTFALIATVALSFNMIAGKYGMSEGGFNATTFAFLWVASTAVYCFLIIALSRGLKGLHVPRHALRIMLVISAITGINQVIGWTGLSLLDPSFAAFLNRAAPVFIILGCVMFLGERLKLFEVMFFLVMIAGGCMSAWADWDNADTRTGIVCVVVACLAVAIQRILIKVSVRHVAPMVVNFYRSLGGAITVGTFALATGQMRFDVGAGYWAAALVGALIGPCISVTLLYKSYRYWDLSKSTMLMMIQPLLVLPASFLFLNMLPSRMQFAGGMIIMAGALGMVWMHSRANRLNSPHDRLS
jgi:drug/metabolite transporter (DMT)-like permease